MVYAHTTSRILPICYLIPGFVTLPAPEARDFMGLVQLYSMYLLIYFHFHSPFNIIFKLRGVSCASTRDCNVRCLVFRASSFLLFVPSCATTVTQNDGTARLYTRPTFISLKQYAGTFVVEIY